MQLTISLLRAQYGKWWLALSICGVALALGALPDGFANLSYDRSALESGQLWRIVTGHCVHLNTAHLLYNLLGLYLLCELLWVGLPLQHGMGIVLATMLVISGALWWFHPEIVWYVGLSGVLHGLWAGSALVQCKRSKRSIFKASLNVSKEELRQWLPYLGLAVLFLKLFSESLSGYGAPIEANGMAVVTVAHLYGALTGIVYVVVWRVYKRWRCSD